MIEVALAFCILGVVDVSLVAGQFGTLISKGVDVENFDFAGSKFSLNFFELSSSAFSSNSSVQFGKLDSAVSDTADPVSFDSLALLNLLDDVLVVNTPVDLGTDEVGPL